MGGKCVSINPLISSISYSKREAHTIKPWGRLSRKDRQDHRGSREKTTAACYPQMLLLLLLKLWIREGFSLVSLQHWHELTLFNSFLAFEYWYKYFIERQYFCFHIIFFCVLIICQSTFYHMWCFFILLQSFKCSNFQNVYKSMNELPPYVSVVGLKIRTGGESYF